MANSPSLADLVAAGASESEAAMLASALASLPGTPDQVWRRVSKELLQPDHPFALHKLLMEARQRARDCGVQALPRDCCQGQRPDVCLRGITPVWIPPPPRLSMRRSCRK
mmetsp:Transcript_13566/g.34819  ORF Transcript_13566/g.34819 Transcript_13566/m.34819 type:complete len:110 (-) Transcript_13566:52-381(-)